MRFPGALLVLSGLLSAPLGILVSQAQEFQPDLPPPAAAVPPPIAEPPPPLPLASEVKGNRPKLNPALVPPPATQLLPSVGDLPAPPSLGLPVKPDQVSIAELRPLTLEESENLAEVNNPNLKALASQVEQAASALRAEIALWYPQLNLNGSPFPSYTGGQQFSTGLTGTGQQRGLTLSSIWRMQTALEASWGLIDPSRNPRIAAARDEDASGPRDRRGAARPVDVGEERVRRATPAVGGERTLVRRRGDARSSDRLCARALAEHLQRAGSRVHHVHPRAVHQHLVGHGVADLLNGAQPLRQRIGVGLGRMHRHIGRNTRQHLIARDQHVQCRTVQASMLG